VAEGPGLKNGKVIIKTVKKMEKDVQTFESDGDC